MSFDREKLRTELAALAAQGVYLGTSSWKYAGWLGQLYDRARYENRGRFAQSRFERNCLAEYAEAFKTVCVDAAYYAFPNPDYLQGLTAKVPADFLFGFKVTDEITLKRYPNLPRFGPRAGKLNDHYLDAEQFASSFLKPFESIRPQVGVFLFEFSRFFPSDYEQGREFVEDLDGFLAQLPAGWPYAVELRNKHWLQPEYFACLSKRRVAHVFNSWQAMPAVAAQIEISGSRPHPGLVAARFLLKPGRRYEEAVKNFQPYDRVKEVYAEARAAGRKLIAEGRRAGPDRKTYIYVNNRLEGNALETIRAMLEEIEAGPARLAPGDANPLEKRE